MHTPGPATTQAHAAAETLRLQLAGGCAVPGDPTERTASIRAELLARSASIEKPDFDTIHPDDLELLFDAYDAHFFGGKVRAALEDVPLRFRLSRRMTSAGGMTTRHMDHRAGKVAYYTIAVSTTILFNNFREGQQRSINACGLVCTDRVQALQRIMEHELIHLIEMLVWRNSSCSAARFQGIARSYFGHTAHTHALVTPRETAHMEHGIRPGLTVSFQHEGQRHIGRVNRVTRRATVLVPDPQGERYSNGQHYRKYYVPVQMLTVVKA